MEKAAKGKMHIRVSKRDTIPFSKAFGIRVLAVIGALLLSAIMVVVLGYSPIGVFRQIVVGSLGTPKALISTIERTVPLLITSLAIILAFRMRFWNIGANGQIALGAVAASFFAYQFAGKIPHVPLIILMFIGAAIAGGVWGVIPALAKAKWDTNETLFTLMMNYISIYLIQFLRRGPWEDPKMKSFGQTPMFDASARLSDVFGVYSGWIVAIVLVFLVYIYLYYTKQGYEISVVGESNNTARYAGMNVKTIFIRTMLISGALAGVAGMLKISGADFKLNETVAGSIGFTAITIAWLSKLNPLTSLVVAFLFSALEKGCESVSSASELRVNGLNIPSASAMVIMGIILFFVLGCEFFINYRIHITHGERSREAAL